MLTYETIAQEIELALAASPHIDAAPIQSALKGRKIDITGQRLGVVLARMSREGRIKTNGKKHRPTYTLVSQSDAPTELSGAMQDKAEIHAFRPLVSAPKVAPLRDYPAWSRQQL